MGKNNSAEMGMYQHTNLEEMDSTWFRKSLIRKCSNSSELCQLVFQGMNWSLTCADVSHHANLVVFKTEIAGLNTLNTFYMV